MAAACAAVFFTSSPLAWAGWEEDFPRCQDEDAAPDQRLESCSRVIGDPSAGPEIRAEAYLNRGILQDEAGAPLKAIADLTEAIKLNPEYPSLYFYRGVAYDNANKTRLSIADFSEAIRLDPSEFDAFLYRGAAYADLGEHEKALADLNAALALDANDATAYALRAEVFEAKGDREKAVADFRKALELEPDNEDAAEGLKRLDPK